MNNIIKDSLKNVPQHIQDMLKGIKEKKQQFYATRRRKVLLSDLLKMTHRVGKVELPFPNLFAYTQMERYFEDLSRIDLRNGRHLTAVRWFLQNNNRIEIANMTFREMEQKINEEMTRIPLSQLGDYQACIQEIFWALEKKNIHTQQKMLTQILEMLNSGGPNPSSPS